MTRKVPPTDPIRRPRSDFEPGPEWPAWFERIVAVVVGASLIAGVGVLVVLTWALVVITRYTIESTH